MKTLIRIAAELDDKALRGKPVVVRVAGVAGRPQLYVEVSRRALRRVLDDLASGFVWLDDEPLAGSLVAEIDAVHRGELEGRVIG